MASQARALNVLFLIVLACVVAGIVGWVVHGLLWLFVIALVVFILAVLGWAYRIGAVRTRRRASR